MSGAPDSLFSAPADLGERDLKRLIVRLGLPTVVGLTANAAHHVANALFIGMIGVEAIAAVTVVLPIVILVAAFGEGLGLGAAAEIGRLLGAGRKRQASAVASSAFALAFVLGPLLTLILVVARRPLLEAFGATSDMLPFAETYLLVVGLGATLILLQMIADFVAIAEGNTRFSMWTLVGGFGLNVALDPILIFVLGLGVGGAALATILSQLAVLAVYAFYFRRRLGVLRVAPRLARFSRRVLWPVAAIGGPAALASMLTGAAFAILYFSAGRYGGEAAVAAVGVALRVMTFGDLPVIGFALGAQAVLSYAWGAGDRPRMIEAARFMACAASGFSVLYAAAAIIFARPIAGLFVSDPAVQTFAVEALIAAHIFFPFVGLRAVLLVMLQAMERSREAALLGLAANGYLLALPLAVLPARFGFAGVTASLATSAALATLLATVLALRLRAELREPVALVPESALET